MNYAVLQKCSLFHGMTAEEIEGSLAAIPYHVEDYKKGMFIVFARDEARRVGVILSGRARVEKLFGAGSQMNVTVRTAGDMIGPAAVFSKAGKYPCDIVALEPTSILMIRKEDLLALMQRSSRMMTNFLGQLASAAYMLQQKIELLSYNGISQKIAFSLLMHQRQTGKSAFRIPSSVTNWAMMLNVSRPSLHRELKKMEESGLIRYAPPIIEMLDPDGLAALLS